MSSLFFSNSIKFLDLSHNEITKEGCKHIRLFLEKNTSLTVLFLHWNIFNAAGGKEIAYSLIKNATLLVLDMSFCHMGLAKVADLTMPDLSSSKGGKKSKKKGSKSKEKGSKDEKPEKKKKGKSKSPKKKGQNKMFNDSLNAHLSTRDKFPSQRFEVDMTCAEAWSEAFLENKTLVHLDLAHNSFDKQEVRVMGKIFVYIF